MSTHDTDEQELLAQTLAWRDRVPAADLRGLPAVAVPALGRLRGLLPAGSAGRMLAVAYTAALRTARPERLLRAADADDFDTLRARPLPEVRALARRAAARDMALAAGAGTVFGFAGAAGMAADAPALVLLALRVLIRVGYCHGEPPSPALAAALFALASADTAEEKRLAWRAALSARPSDAAGSPAVDDAALRDGLERAAEREFAKQALSGSLQKLGLSMAQRLGWRKAAGALPVLGAAVGGAVNARFIAQVAEAAIQVHTARRLAAAGHDLLSETPAAEPKRRRVAVKRAATKAVR